MDELTGIPTYELLDTLPPETITDGEFITDDRYDSGRQIFAASEQDGVRRECWISLDYGLLTESILKREDETVYDALQTGLEILAAATRPLTTSSSCRTARRRSNDRYNYVSDLRQEEGCGRQQNGQRILLLSIHGQKQQDQEHQQIARVDAARQQPRQEAARILPDRQRRARRRRLRRGFWHRRRRRRLHRRRGRDVFHARGAVDARGVGDITVIHHGVSFGPGPAAPVFEREGSEAGKPRGLQRPVDLRLPVLAQKWLEGQKQSLLLLICLSRLPQHGGRGLRQGNGLLHRRLRRLREAGAAPRQGGGSLLRRGRIRLTEAERACERPQLLQLRRVVQYGAQRALELIH